MAYKSPSTARGGKPVRRLQLRHHGSADFSAGQKTTLLIDCRSLGTKAVSMPKGVAVVIINSNLSAPSSAAVNTRREQCETGARSSSSPPCAMSYEQFNAVAHELDPVVAKRVRHVLTENARTVEAASALEKGDLKRMGELMAESHASMRDDFEITVPQIDTLVEIVKAAIGEGAACA